MRILQPSDWVRPKGYSNGISTRGEMIFVAGQVGWNKNEEFESDSFTMQAAQALRNILRILERADARAEHLVRLTWFIADEQEYLSSLKPLGATYKEIIGNHFPVMSVIVVKGFIETGAKLEIEATAVIPDDVK